MVGNKVYTANGGNTQMSCCINNAASGVCKIPDDVTEYAKWVIEPACCVVNLISRGGKLILGSWHRHQMPFDGTCWHLGGATVLNISPVFNHFYNDTIVRQTGRLV